MISAVPPCPEGLAAAEKRNVNIDLPCEVLLKVEPFRGPGEAATVRQPSDAGGTSQWNGSKKGRGPNKSEATEMCPENAGTPESAEEKQQPTLLVCHLPPSRLLWESLLYNMSNVEDGKAEERQLHQKERKPSQEGLLNSRPLGVYASTTAAAVSDAVSSLSTSPLCLWVGGRLDRQTEEVERLLDVLGGRNATNVMLQSLLAAEEYTLNPMKRRGPHGCAGILGTANDVLLSLPPLRMSV